MLFMGVSVKTMKQNVIENKSIEFSVRIVNLYKVLKNSRNETVMSLQLLRSATSIGANIAEAQCALSKKDFLSKMQIAYKECNETKYWLTLLKETDYLKQTEYDSITADCTELLRMLTVITKTASQNLRQEI